MSYTIENSKFVIFGNGYDGVRNDSGDGMNEPEIHPLSTPTHAAFDTTGEYVYFTDGHGDIRKFKVNPWEEVSTNLPQGNIYHPTNVENNIGVICNYPNGITIFNLDTEEIIKTIPTTSGYTFIADCMMDGDDIYLIQKTNGNATAALRHIDLANDTYSYTAIYGANSGFVDTDTIYNYRAGSWYSDPTYANGYSLSYTSQWQGTYTTRANYPVRFGGLCADGYLYLPTFLNDEWVMGVYDGNSVPTFEPVPNPIRTYGNFGGDLSLVISGRQAFSTCYNNGRTKAAFATTIGTFVTDFTNKLTKITDDKDQPLAMCNHYFVAPKGINQVIVYKV